MFSKCLSKRYEVRNLLFERELTTCNSIFMDFHLQLPPAVFAILSPSVPFVEAVAEINSLSSIVIVYNLLRCEYYMI